MKYLYLSVFFLFLAFNSNAQKFGYVDTNFILNKMPEYREAQAEIDNLSNAWQTEIEELYKTIDGKYSALQAEEVLLTPEMKEDRLNEIKLLENDAKEYQRKIFGYEGLYFLKKKELMKPVQDKVFEAIEKVCKQNKLAIMFDKSGELVMIYTDPVHDYTDFVLEELGLGDPNDTVQN